MIERRRTEMENVWVNKLILAFFKDNRTGDLNKMGDTVYVEIKFMAKCKDGSVQLQFS